LLVRNINHKNQQQISASLNTNVCVPSPQSGWPTPGYTVIH